MVPCSPSRSFVLVVKYALLGIVCVRFGRCSGSRAMSASQERLSGVRKRSQVVRATFHTFNGHRGLTLTGDRSNDCSCISHRQTHGVNPKVTK